MHKDQTICLLGPLQNSESQADLAMAVLGPGRMPAPAPCSGLEEAILWSLAVGPGESEDIKAGMWLKETDMALSKAWAGRRWFWARPQIAPLIVRVSLHHL